MIDRAKHQAAVAMTPDRLMDEVTSLRGEVNRLRSVIARIHADIDDVIDSEDAVVRRAAHRAWELCMTEVSWVQPSAMLGDREWQVMSPKGLVSRHASEAEARAALANGVTH